MTKHNNDPAARNLRPASAENPGCEKPDARIRNNAAYRPGFKGHPSIGGRVAVSRFALDDSVRDGCDLDGDSRRITAVLGITQSPR